MVSIIVPIRYRKDLTQVCIDSILNYTKDFELILVQEGIDEDITALLKSYNTKFIQHEVPKGFGSALNAGMKLADGEYYCFMNNDTVVTPGWMEEMLEAFKDEEVGLVTPTFFGFNNRQEVDYPCSRRFDYVINEPLNVAAVCYLAKREMMDAIGGWDESFFHGGEDIDLNIRVSNANYAIVIARKAFIYHYGGASTRELLNNDYKNATEHFMRNLEKIEAKFPGLKLKVNYPQQNKIN